MVMALARLTQVKSKKGRKPSGVIEKSLLEGSRQLPNHVKEGTEYDKGTNDSDSLVNHLKPSRALIAALILR